MPQRKPRRLVGIREGLAAADVLAVDAVGRAVDAVGRAADAVGRAADGVDVAADVAAVMTGKRVVTKSVSLRLIVVRR